MSAGMARKMGEGPAGLDDLPGALYGRALPVLERAGAAFPVVVAAVRAVGAVGPDRRGLPAGRRVRVPDRGDRDREDRRRGNGRKNGRRRLYHAPASRAAPINSIGARHGSPAQIQVSAHHGQDHCRAARPRRRWLVSEAIAAAAAAEWARAARPPNCHSAARIYGVAIMIYPRHPWPVVQRPGHGRALGRHRPAASTRGRGAPP